MLVHLYFRPLSAGDRHTQSAAAHQMLRDALLARGIPTDRQNLQFSINRRPTLLHYPEILFSITHTSTLAAVALAADGGTTRLGLDAEPENRPSPSPRFIPRFFSPAEQMEDASFALIWTRKEAMLKALDLPALPNSAEAAAHELCFTTVTAHSHLLTLCADAPAEVRLIQA